MPRRPWLAALLSLLAPGLGQLYNGDFGCGWWLFALFGGLELTTALILPHTALKIAFAGLLLSMLIELALRIGTAAQAFWRARRIGAIAVARYQRGWLYSLLILIMPVANAIAAPDYKMQSFNTRSGAMIPTLLVGDYFIVERGYYRECAVSRGDVAVFKLPTDPSTDYIKRIVGLPGDHIQVRHGELYINGQLVPRRPTDDYIYQDGGTAVVLHQYIESLPREPDKPALDHPVINVGNNGPLDNTPVYEVPPGHYFAMGDNRDNSQDSRVLSAVGYIPADNLVGKAQFLFFSTDGSAHWWEIWKWPFAIRYRRLSHGVS